MNNLMNGSWKKIRAVRKVRTDIKSIQDAWGQMFPGKPLDLTELENGSFIDERGYMYVKEGCEYVKLDLPEIEEELTETLSTESGDNHVIYNGEKFISITEAAVQIAKDPTSDFAVDCQNFSSFINNWRRDADGALRYNSQVLI
jgi:hypothetical protein